MEQYERTNLLIGEDNLSRLRYARIAVFGVGGVGGFAIEALARSGVGTIDIFDNDVVSISNINRQIIATHSNIGRFKVDVMSERIKDIDPTIKVNAFRVFYMPDNSSEYSLNSYDYVIDAIDTVTAKIELITNAKKTGVPIISSMGTGNKLDPTCLKIADIADTKMCPLARVMRRELKARNIDKLTVVYSEEEPTITKIIYDSRGKAIPASMIFVPSSCGILLASYVVRNLIDKSDS